MRSRTRTISEVFLSVVHMLGGGGSGGLPFNSFRLRTTYIYVIFVLLQAYVNYFSPSSNHKPIYLMLGQK